MLETLLHAFEGLLVPVALDESSLGAGTTLLQPAAGAVGRARRVDAAHLGLVELLEHQDLAGGTAVGIARGVVPEPIRAKELATGMLWGAVERHKGCNRRLLAGYELRAVRVARIGHHVQGPATHGFLGRLGDWLELRGVVTDVGHFMVHDQAVL